MKKAALYTVFAFIVFQMVVYALYLFANKGLRYYNKPVYEQFDLLFNENENPDLLFLGSSRTHYGINPLILEKLSGKTALNAGLEGAKINEMEIVLNAFLSAHSNPEKIFLMLDPHSLDLKEAGVYNKIPFASYLNNNMVYAELRKNIGWAPFFWKYLPYSIITSFDDYTRANCLRGLFGKTYLLEHQYSYKGYISLNKSYRAEDSLISLQHALNGDGMKVLLRMAKICNTKNIPLQILQGPYLSSFYEENKLNTFYNEINKVLSSHKLVKTQTEPLNYGETVNFKDQVHLNETGATQYSKDVYLNFIKDVR